MIPRHGRVTSAQECGLTPLIIGPSRVREDPSSYSLAAPTCATSSARRRFTRQRPRSRFVVVIIRFTKYVLCSCLLRLEQPSNVLLCSCLLRLEQPSNVLLCSCLLRLEQPSNVLLCSCLLRLEQPSNVLLCSCLLRLEQPSNVLHTVALQLVYSILNLQ